MQINFSLFIDILISAYFTGRCIRNGYLFDSWAINTLCQSRALQQLLGMTPNYANTISNMEKGCQEIPLQGKELYNSRKFEKIVAVYQTNKLVFSKKYISLETRSSEKVPYSKISCSRLFFFYHHNNVHRLFKLQIN